jgi:hypothetical protein
VSGHTLGPWFIEGGDIVAYVESEGSEGSYVPICTGVADDDAVLIAAAPEMKRALELIFGVYQRDFPTALKKKNAYEREMFFVEDALRMANGWYK